MQSLLRRFIIGCVCFVLIGSVFGVGLGSSPQTVHAAGPSCPHLILDDSHKPYRLYMSDCTIKVLTTATDVAGFIGSVATVLKPELATLLSEVPALAVAGLVIAGGSAALKHYDDVCSHHGMWIGLDPNVFNWHPFFPNQDVLCSPVPPLADTDGLALYDTFNHLWSKNVNVNNWDKTVTNTSHKYSACSFFSDPNRTTYNLVVQARSDIASYAYCYNRKATFDKEHGFLLDVQYYYKYEYMPHDNGRSRAAKLIFLQNNGTLYSFNFALDTGKYILEKCKTRNQPSCVYLAQGQSSKLMSPKGDLKDVALGIRKNTFTVYSADDVDDLSLTASQPTNADAWERIVVARDPSFVPDDMKIGLFAGVGGHNNFFNLAITSVRVWQLS